MRFGTDKKNIFALTAIICVLFSIACSQTPSQKMENAQEHIDKARDFRMKGDLQNALSEQLKAVELDPSDDDAQMLLGGIYIDLRRYEKAVAPLQKSIGINDKNASAHYLLSWAFGELGKDKEALEAIKKAVEIRPEEISYLIALGAEYEQSGDKNSAKETFEKILQINPKNIPAMYRLGTLEVENGNMKRAGEIFEKAVNTEITEENDRTFVNLCREELEKISRKKN